MTTKSAEEPIITKRQLEVFELIAQNPQITRNELAERLNINVSAVRKHIDALRAKGLIERQGGNRGQWVVTSRP